MSLFTSAVAQKFDSRRHQFTSWLTLSRIHAMPHDPNRSNLHACTTNLQCTMYLRSSLQPILSVYHVPNAVVSERAARMVFRPSCRTGLSTRDSMSVRQIQQRCLSSAISQRVCTLWYSVRAAGSNSSSRRDWGAKSHMLQQADRSRCFADPQDSCSSCRTIAEGRTDVRSQIVSRLFHVSRLQDAARKHTASWRCSGVK